MILGAMQRLLIITIIGILSACDVDDQAVVRDGTLPQLQIIENERGEAVFADTFGRPVVGDLTFTGSVRIDQGGYQALLDGQPIGADGCVTASGELDVASIEGGNDLRCACVDANGVHWTQDCPWWPFWEIPCSECCAQHGGDTPPPRLTLNVNRPGKNSCP